MNDEAKAKRLSVERIYQKKTQLEHILLRPDTYVGSIEEITKQMWIYDEDSEAIVCKTISFVPGLYKIFDEILGLFFDRLLVCFVCITSSTSAHCMKCTVECESHSCGISISCITV